MENQIPGDPILAGLTGHSGQGFEQKATRASRESGHVGLKLTEQAPVFFTPAPCPRENPSTLFSSRFRLFGRFDLRNTENGFELVANGP